MSIINGSRIISTCQDNWLISAAGVVPRKLNLQPNGPMNIGKSTVMPVSRQENWPRMGQWEHCLD
jgi:hypothetical protein